MSKSVRILCCCVFFCLLEACSNQNNPKAVVLPQNGSSPVVRKQLDGWDKQMWIERTARACLFDVTTVSVAKEFATE